MQDRYLEAFADATLNTFGTMCGLEVARNGACFEKKGVFPTYEAVAVMGFSGTVRGAVILTMPLPVAKAVVSAFVGETITKVNADLTDGLGELLNIITGAATSTLGDQDLKISLPTVLIGREQRLSTKQNAPWYVLPLRIEGQGELSLQVSTLAS